jgi:hypothetical protein
MKDREYVEDKRGGCVQEKKKERQPHKKTRAQPRRLATASKMNGLEKTVGNKIIAHGSCKG